MAKTAKKGAAKKSTGKRTLIDPKGDKRYIRRDAKGRISESDDQGKSLSQDRKKAAKTKVEPGYGDRGDQPKKRATGPKKGASKKSAPSKGSRKSK